jgi:hypothetical protein
MSLKVPNLQTEENGTTTVENAGRDDHNSVNKIIFSSSSKNGNIVTNLNSVCTWRI